ncbi:hypothetical protein SSX86_015693 [Deinandra increscens subsp. villosa]|uniref:TF-B3 domain-containing protein n=1 Tax=Deinandra increscens subsp. villosa TaxID=3103831 RepID=A0AAP0D3Z2_9ASTR
MPSRRKLRNFFRFITSDQCILKIPKKFTREHREQILLNDVVLIVSDDKVWPLGLMVSGDGKLWLHNGWPEFQQHYSLKFGHLLVFDHLGKSVFHVRIFDPSYQEMYNLPPVKYIKPENEIDQSEIRENEGKIYTIGRAEDSGKRAFESSKSSKSKKPFYAATIRDSYLRASRVYAPVPFCRRYLIDNQKDGSCVLQMSGGRKWGPVNCRVYKTYGRLCGANWKKFSDENHLGVGDVCVFRLINDVKKVMKVTIYRAS